MYPCFVCGTRFGGDDGHLGAGPSEYDRLARSRCASSLFCRRCLRALSTAGIFTGRAFMLFAGVAALVSLLDVPSVLHVYLLPPWLTLRTPKQSTLKMVVTRLLLKLLPVDAATRTMVPVLVIATYCFVVPAYTRSYASVTPAGCSR